MVAVDGSGRNPDAGLGRSPVRARRRGPRAEIAGTGGSAHSGLRVGWRPDRTRPVERWWRCAGGAPHWAYGLDTASAVRPLGCQDFDQDLAGVMSPAQTRLTALLATAGRRRSDRRLRLPLRTPLSGRRVRQADSSPTISQWRTSAWSSASRMPAGPLVTGPRTPMAPCGNRGPSSTSTVGLTVCRGARRGGIEHPPIGPQRASDLK